MHSSDLDKPSSLLRQEAVVATMRHKLKEKPQLNEIYWWQGEQWRGKETGIKTLPQHLTYSLSNLLWLWLVAPWFECITQPQNTKAQASINKACVFQAVPVCADLGLSAHSAWLTEVATFCSNKLETPLAIHFWGCGRGRYTTDMSLFAESPKAPVIEFSQKFHVYATTKEIR